MIDFSKINDWAEIEEREAILAEENDRGEDMSDRLCCDPCNHCGTDENGNYTEDKCPKCGARSKGEVLCSDCEDLCVGCGFRLKQKNSLFCDRDKCIRGTFEVTSAEGNVLFVGISEEAKAYHKNREGN